MKRYIFYIAIFIVWSGILFPLFANGAGLSIRNFYVDPEYEISGNSQETAIHLTSSTRAYLFVEKNYYDKILERDRETFINNVSNLGVKFDSDIYLKTLPNENRRN